MKGSKVLKWKEHATTLWQTGLVGTLGKWFVQNPKTIAKQRNIEKTTLRQLGAHCLHPWEVNACRRVQIQTQIQLRKQKKIPETL